MSIITKKRRKKQTLKKKKSIRLFAASFWQRVPGQMTYKNIWLPDVYVFGAELFDCWLGDLTSRLHFETWHFSYLLHHFALYLKAVGHIYLTNKKTSQSANSVKWYVRNDAINHGNNMPQRETIEMRPPNSRQSSILQHHHIWWNQIETENKLVNKIIFLQISSRRKQMTSPHQIK